MNPMNIDINNSDNLCLLESNSVLKTLDLSWNHLRQLGAVAICWSVAVINNNISSSLIHIQTIHSLF